MGGPARLSADDSRRFRGRGPLFSQRADSNLRCEPLSSRRHLPVRSSAGRRPVRCVHRRLADGIVSATSNTHSRRRGAGQRFRSGACAWSPLSGPGFSDRCRDPGQTRPWICRWVDGAHTPRRIDLRPSLYAGSTDYAPGSKVLVIAVDRRRRRGLVRVVRSRRHGRVLARAIFGSVPGQHRYESEFTRAGRVAVLRSSASYGRRPRGRALCDLHDYLHSGRCASGRRKSGHAGRTRGVGDQRRGGPGPKPACAAVFRTDRILQASVVRSAFARSTLCRRR